MRIITYIIFFIILIIGITFAYLNANPVGFNYYLGTKMMPLSLLLILAFGSGIVISFIFIMLTWIRLKSQNFVLKKHIHSLERDIAELKNTSN